MPERLAHLILGQLRASVPRGATFNLSIKDMPSKVASFAEILRTTTIIERDVPPRLSSLKRYHVSDKSNGLNASAG